MPASPVPLRGGLAVAACAVTCAVACAGLAACSAASSPDAQATGNAERARVLPAASQLNAQLRAAGVAWTGGIAGGYQACGANDPLAAPGGSSSLQYTASEQLGPFSAAVSYPAFKRQVVEALDAESWNLQPAAGGAVQDTYYAGRHGGLDLRLIEADEQTFGPTATAYVSGSCFDAGSSAQQLLQQSPDYDAHEPPPTATATPAPSYS